jgi:hypothetical protein
MPPADLDRPDLLHPLLALLLLLEQLALPADVAAVALGQHVLALGLDRLPRDDARPDGGLDRHVEELARDDLAQPLDHHLAGRVGLVAVDDQAQRVDDLARQQHVDADEVRHVVAGRLVVEGGVPLRPRLQLVVEVEHDLGQRRR